LDKLEKIQKKKKIILEALIRCLERDVYSRISVQDVADEAGFSKGGLLHYYPTKEDMYLDLVDFLAKEIQRDHLAVLRGTIKSKEKVGLSVLYGIEKFFLDTRTIRLYINLVLYGFEDEKIMLKLRESVRQHLNLYEYIIREARSDMPQRRKTDVDPQFLARIAQIIVMSAALYETMDPIPLDTGNLMKHVFTIFKG
jgi:AcrR family transcriptional regulator